jgi:hypothetical protein
VPTAAPTGIAVTTSAGRWRATRRRRSTSPASSRAPARRQRADRNGASTVNAAVNWANPVTPLDVEPSMPARAATSLTITVGSSRSTTHSTPDITAAPAARATTTYASRRHRRVTAGKASTASNSTKPIHSSAPWRMRSTAGDRKSKRRTTSASRSSRGRSNQIVTAITRQAMAL